MSSKQRAAGSLPAPGLWARPRCWPVSLRERGASRRDRERGVDRTATGNDPGS